MRIRWRAGVRRRMRLERLDFTDEPVFFLSYEPAVFKVWLGRVGEFHRWVLRDDPSFHPEPEERIPEDRILPEFVPRPKRMHAPELQWFHS